MKKFLTIALLGVLLVFSGCAKSEAEPAVTVDINGDKQTITGFAEIENSMVSMLDAAGFDRIVVYDCSELTAEILESRKGTTIIERCIGLVTDKEAGDGRILNTTSEGDYISYRRVYHPKTEGTVILSYMVYGSDNNHIDDIVERYDFILSREWED